MEVIQIPRKNDKFSSLKTPAEKRQECINNNYYEFSALIADFFEAPEPPNGNSMLRTLKYNHNRGVSKLNKYEHEVMKFFHGLGIKKTCLPKIQRSYMFQILFVPTEASNHAAIHAGRQKSLASRNDCQFHPRRLRFWCELTHDLLDVVSCC